MKVYIIIVFVKDKFKKKDEIMLAPNFANFLGQSFNSSISTAGVCAITSIADPKAAAFGTLASSVAGYAAEKALAGLFNIDTNSGAIVLLGSLVAIKIVAGGTAGKYVNKEFNYFDMCASYFTTVLITSLVTNMLGVKNLNV